MDIKQLQTFANQIRIKTLEMIYHSKASHIASCLSCADILAALYGGCLNCNPIFPHDPHRDRLIISKGHAAAAVYAALALKGFFPLSLLSSYGEKDTFLLGHVSHHVPGIEYSSGSLGHGVSIGCGIALGLRSKGVGARTAILASDGELNEGSFWEGVMFAAHHQLNNLCVIIDNNGMQSLGSCDGILKMSGLKEKFEAFGFEAIDVDGHDIEAVYQSVICKNHKPKAIIATTVKGKGVSFMENNLLWHYKNPSYEQMLQAKSELECVKSSSISC